MVGLVRRLSSDGFYIKWRTRRDSNARPSAPEADALSTELRVRAERLYHSEDGNGSSGAALRGPVSDDRYSPLHPVIQHKLIPLDTCQHADGSLGSQLILVHQLAFRMPQKQAPVKRPRQHSFVVL